MKTVAKPSFLYSSAALAAMTPDKLGGWTPEQTPILWMNTNICLARTHQYDRREDHFDCLVQFRVMGLDRLEFRRITGGEVVLTKTTVDPEKASFLEAARRMTGTDEPDDGASFGRIINVDAIYHDSFIAVPWQWRCVKEAVFGDESWRAFLERATVDDILKGRTLFMPLWDVTSPRISFYETAHHCSWRVGEENFFVPNVKRSPHPAHDITRMANGWDESVRPHHMPDIDGVTIDPKKKPRGAPLKGDPRGDATLSMRREMLGRGLQLA